MPLFNVTNAATGRTLHIRAACRTCARRIAVEHIALTGPTAAWRDPEQTRVDFVGPDKGASGVLKDSAGEVSARGMNGWPARSGSRTSRAIQ